MLPASKKLLSLKCLFSVHQPMRCLISWKACLLSLSLTGLSVVCWGTGCLKRHFYSFTSLVFVSEAASKADLYFPCKGGQVYCVVCLVIYGAGEAHWPLPVSALNERHQERLQLCCPLTALQVMWEWHWALAALLTQTSQYLLV